MSTSKKLVLFLSLVAFATVGRVIGDNGDKTTLDYYWGKARVVTQQADPNRAGIAYSFTARSYYRTTNDEGTTVRLDSLVARYFYSSGKLDSQVTLAGDKARFSRLDLSVPDVFRADLHLNFFPNDTGGPRMAIGFAADSAVNGLSDGLVVLDRYTYRPLTMYLFYRNYADYKRYTRSLRMVDVDEWLFPDSIWVVATRNGIFAPESYRLETGISDVNVGP